MNIKNFPSAREVLVSGEKFRDYLFEKELAYARREIIEAALNGKKDTGLTISMPVYNEIFAFLVDQGYDVTPDGDCDCTYGGCDIIVSWEEAEIKENLKD